MSMIAPAGDPDIRAVHSLLDWVREHNDWPLDSPIDQVVRATFAQATKTFGAIVCLLDQEYGTDALRLSRSLFETVVVGYWMTHVAESESVLTDYLGVAAAKALEHQLAPRGHEVLAQSAR